MKSIERLKKFVEGGMIIKADGGLEIPNPFEETDEWKNYQSALEQLTNALTVLSNINRSNFASGRLGRLEYKSAKANAKLKLQEAKIATRSAETDNVSLYNRNLKAEEIKLNFTEAGKSVLGSISGTSEGTDLKGLAIGATANIGSKVLDAVDNVLMGDKNFGAQSAAIDSAVDGAASALMSSGNPYAMAAAGALKVANFITKVTGDTVQGYDVDINSSGYGTLSHQDSSSSRDFGAFLGLGGLNGAAARAKMARRNKNAQDALEAADIDRELKFEQEARSNSIDNVILNNKIALAGGLDTSLLGG